MDINKKTAYFHLPGLFEFYEFYCHFLPLFYEHREYFYEYAEIASIYGSPDDCLWSGGRIGIGENQSEKIKLLLQRYGISARLTFSNSLLNQTHLNDEVCNKLCQSFEDEHNGIIIYSDLLLDYIQQNYPKYHFISSTTKVITDFNEFVKEINREQFSYVVPDFRLNKSFDKLKGLSSAQKDKVEFLCNECCYIGCKDRKACYENVSRQNLDASCPDFICRAPDLKGGYRFSQAMKNPSFISNEDIIHTYLPLGFSNFKIEGRGLGSALLLEFLLYYLTKPEYQLIVREEIYLDNTLDLF